MGGLFVFRDLRRGSSTLKEAFYYNAMCKYATHIADD